MRFHALVVYITADEVGPRACVWPSELCLRERAGRRRPGLQVGVITSHDGSITAVIRYQTKGTSRAGQRGSGGGADGPRHCRPVTRPLDEVSAPEHGEGWRERSTRVQLQRQQRLWILWGNVGAAFLLCILLFITFSLIFLRHGKQTKRSQTKERNTAWWLIRQIQNKCYIQNKMKHRNHRPPHYYWTTRRRLSRVTSEEGSKKTLTVNHFWFHCPTSWTIND